MYATNHSSVTIFTINFVYALNKNTNTEFKLNSMFQSWDIEIYSYTISAVKRL